MVNCKYRSDEERLLLYCTNLEVNQYKAYQIDTILTTGNISWNWVIETSARHRITPLLYNNLKNSRRIDNIPKQIIQKLRSAYYTTAYRNTVTFDQFTRIAELAKDSGINIIVMKGIFLAEKVYSDIALRPMCDIDLLVTPKSLAEFDTLMRHEGYLGSLEPEQIAMVPGQSIEYNRIENGRRATIVEVHTDVRNKGLLFPIEIATIWRNAQPIQIGGTDVLSMSHEDAIIFLCLHNFYHGFDSLLRLCDISSFLRHYEDEIDWHKLAWSVKEYGVRSIFWYNLILANHLLEMPIDDFLARELGEGRQPRRKYQVMSQRMLRLIRNEENIFAPNLNADSQGIWIWILWILSSESFAKKIVSILSIFFPPPNELRVRYNMPRHSRLVYFFYFIRPAQLLLYYARSGLGFLFKALRS